MQLQKELPESSPQFVNAALVSGTPIEPTSHEAAEIEHLVDQLWVLLDDLREASGIDHRDRQLLVERVVVPIHFGQREDAADGFVPPAIARVATQEQRRRGRLQRTLDG